MPPSDSPMFVAASVYQALAVGGLTTTRIMVSIATQTTGIHAEVSGTGIGRHTWAVVGGDGDLGEKWDAIALNEVESW